MRLLLARTRARAEGGWSLAPILEEPSHQIISCQAGAIHQKWNFRGNHPIFFGHMS